MYKLNLHDIGNEISLDEFCKVAHDAVKEIIDIGLESDPLCSSEDFFGCWNVDGQATLQETIEIKFVIDHDYTDIDELVESVCNFVSEKLRSHMDLNTDLADFETAWVGYETELTLKVSLDKISSTTINLVKYFITDNLKKNSKMSLLEFYNDIWKFKGLEYLDLNLNESYSSIQMENIVMCAFNTVSTKIYDRHIVVNSMTQNREKSDSLKKFYDYWVRQLTLNPFQTTALIHNC